MWKFQCLSLLLCILSLFYHLIPGNNATLVAKPTFNSSSISTFDIKLNAIFNSTTNSSFSTTPGTKLATSNTEELLRKVPGRIVNGTKATLGQFPQQVSLRRRYSQSHFCGGSILTPKWVISAGHCMLDKLGNIIEAYTILIIAGEIVLKSKTHARQSSYVTKLIVHPEFDMDTLQNDVSLLQLSTPLKFDYYVGPISIARFPMKAGTVCQVSGWGYHKFDEHIVSSNLMYVDIPLMPIPLCRELLVNYSSIPEGMFCAGYLEGGRDACQGDSGGGLLCYGLLTGVVSGGEGCASPRLPGLYADVRYYLPWIEEHVNFTQKDEFYRTFSGNSATALSSSFVALLVIMLLYVAFEQIKDIR